MRIRRNARWTAAAAGAVSSIIMLAACGGGGASDNADESLTPFTTAVFQSEIYLSDYVMKAQGIDHKHGLDVSFVTPDSGAAAAQLMLAGKIQGWLTDPLIVLTAASKQQNIKLAGIAIPVLSYYILTSADGDWPGSGATFEEKVKALKGKVIGVSGIGAGTDHALLAALNEVGISKDQVERVGIGQQQAAIGQLKAGRIDAFVSFSLAGNKMIQQQTGASVYLTLSDPSVPAPVRDIPGAGFAVSGDFADSDPELVSAWLSAEKESYDWISKNQGEAAKILNDSVYNGADLELAKEILPQLLDGPFSETPEGFKVPHETFDAALGALKVLGDVPQDSPLSYDDVVIPEAREE